MPFRPPFARKGTDAEMPKSNTYELQHETAIKGDNGTGATSTYEIGQDGLKAGDGGHVRVQETAGGAEYTGPDHTYTDQQDMHRLGKKQELRRNFRFTSILGFVAIAMGTWEVILSATAAGLTNGGTGGMVS